MNTLKRYAIAAMVLIPLLFFAVSCQKDETVAQCPVDYTIDTEGTYSLPGKWKFVGFENTTTGDIEYPICGGVQSYIVFTDSLNTRSGDPAYDLQYRFYGVALINHFSGTFDRTEGEELMLSPTVKTTVSGTPQVASFEARFHEKLVRVERYEIRNNELFLYPSSGDIVLHFVATNNTPKL